MLYNIYNHLSICNLFLCRVFVNLATSALLLRCPSSIDSFHLLS